jgi:hypothetical protein
MKKVVVENIENGMVLGREVCGTGGNVLLTKGTALNKAMGRRLQNWGITSVYIEGEEEQQPEESVVSISPEALKEHLKEKFSKVIKEPNMGTVFNAVYQYRLKHDGR